MNDIYQRIVDSLEGGTSVAVATLMSRRGSSPGSLGAKMLVFPDGHTEGSIGGGCVEAEVWDGAKDASAGRPLAGARLPPHRQGHGRERPHMRWIDRDS